MRLLSALWLAVSLLGCHPQNQEHYSAEVKEVEKPTLRAYDSGDVVYQIYLDKAGAIWFATSREGVYKYDGQSLTNYRQENGLCGNEVAAIMEDDQGNFWFGTENGLCQFDGKTFATIPLPQYPKKSDWLDSYYPMINPQAVTKILQDRRGDFWVGSNCAGLYKYDGNEFTAFLQEKGNLMPDSMHHNCISALVEDKQGHVWVGSFSHGGVSEFNGKEFIHHALPDGFGDGMISSLYLDRKEVLWAGTRNAGIYRYRAGTFENFPGQEGEAAIAMAKFFEDSKGNLWVASYARKGVYQFTVDGFRPFQLEKSDQLIDVMCMAEDRDGNLWFGGRYGLLWRYDGKELVDFTQRKRGILEGGNR